jgi:hypothetical protein
MYADTQAADFDVCIDLPEVDFDSVAQVGFEYVRTTSTPRKASKKVRS